MPTLTVRLFGQDVLCEVISYEHYHRTTTEHAARSVNGIENHRTDRAVIVIHDRITDSSGFCHPAGALIELHAAKLTVHA